MRVMVTGGAGYVGSVVVEELLAGGHGVVVYDNLYKGHRDAVPAAAVFVEGDVLDRATLRAALRDHGVDAVVHMAAHSEVGPSHAEPERYRRNNVEGGLRLLEAMGEAGVNVIVFSSTAAVYGDAARPPIGEDQATAPGSPYAETKLAFEQALSALGQSDGLRHASLRYFNAAGATERSGERHDPETHLVPLVLDVAAGRRPDVTVFGSDYPTRDGTAVRDYVHVADLARAHVLALAALAHPRAPDGPLPPAINLGSGTGHTVLEVVDAVRRVTGRPVPVRAGPRRPGDAAALVASFALAERTLGWRPVRGDLDDIVASAWHFMRRRAPGTRADLP